MFGIESNLDKNKKVIIHHLKIGDKVKHISFCYNGKTREGIYLGRNTKAGSNYPNSVLVQWHPIEYWKQVSSCNSFDLYK